MIRRLAVLGLAVAICGALVAGQTAQTDAPVTPELLQQDGPVVKLGHSNPPVGLPTGQSRPGPLSLRVESVGPLLTRISLMRDGAEELALTGGSFTATTDAKGTTITTYNVEVTHLGGTLMILRDGRPFVLHVRTDGTWAFRIPSQRQH